MYDLLEYKDKYQSCKKLVTIASVIFICGCGALSYAPHGLPQAMANPKVNIEQTSNLAWHNFLKLLSLGDFLPIKIALNTIEFKRNSIYLTGSPMREHDNNRTKQTLKQYNWHIKKLDSDRIIINKDLRKA